MKHKDFGKGRRNSKHPEHPWWDHKGKLRVLVGASISIIFLWVLVTELPLICDGLLMICILLGAYYLTETDCLTCSGYFLTWNISVCRKDRRRTEGREMKGGRQRGRGERTAGGGGRRWQGQWQWLGQDLRESWLHSPSSTTTKSPDPATKGCLVWINGTEFQKYFSICHFEGL